MHQRDCVGVIITQPETDYQSSLLSGVFAKAFELDMNVAVFNTSTKECCFKDNPESEQSIFTLPNPEKLCGIIYVPDTFKYKNVDEITEQMRKITECPVISVDMELEGFINLISTDDKVIYDMVEHLHCEHGCNTIAYMTGTKGHPHSEARLNGYYSAMEKLGLSYTKEQTYYGDFWYNEGENFVEQLINSADGLPDAILCASNRMAHSVCLALEKRGINVPKDIIVAGYYESAIKLNYISASGKDSADTGSEAVNMINRIKNGEKLEKKTYYYDCTSILNKSISCGCSKSEVKNIKAEKFTIDLSDEEGYFSMYNNFKDNLLEAESFQDFIWTMEWYTYYLKPFEYFSITLCDQWDKAEDDEKSKYLTDKLCMVYDSTHIKDDEYERIVNFDGIDYDKEIMHPVLWKEASSPMAFYFNPIFFHKRCYGFAVLSYGMSTKCPELLYKYWLRDFQVAIESHRRMTNVQYLYSQMKMNAITDSLTGIRNRNGYNMTSETVLELAKRHELKIAVVMADLNCLKFINDNYGHSAGDDAIKIAADALCSAKIKNAESEYCFRMGGDEYLKLAAGYFTANDVDECVKAVNNYLKNYNNNSEKPYPIIVSMGMSIKSADRVNNIDELVAAADRLMLKNKAIVKKETGFDHERNPE